MIRMCGMIGMIPLLFCGCVHQIPFATFGAGPVSDGDIQVSAQTGMYLNDDQVQPGVAVDVSHAELEQLSSTSIGPLLLVRAVQEYTAVYAGAGPLLAYSENDDDQEVAVGADIRAGADYRVGSLLGRACVVFAEVRATYRDVELRGDPSFEMQHCQMIMTDPGEDVSLGWTVGVLIGVRVEL